MCLRMQCSSSVNQQSNHGTMDEEEADHDTVNDLDSISSSSSSQVSSVVSSESDFMEAVSSSSSVQLANNGPLHDMSSLLQQLPFKRGLSKHFRGKSQSFTSLSKVECLEDLAKPENPYKKKLKSCKSHGGGLSAESHRWCSPNTFSRLISKKPSRSSCFSLNANNNTSAFLANGVNGPRIPRHRSTSATTISNQTPLFA